MCKDICTQIYTVTLIKGKRLKAQSIINGKQVWLIDAKEHKTVTKAHLHLLTQKSI